MEEIDGVADGLDRDAGCGNSPAENSALEPEASRVSRKNGEQQECDAHPWAERSKLLVSARVESPGAVQDGAGLQQEKAGQGSHRGGEDQKGAKQAKDDSWLRRVAHGKNRFGTNYNAGRKRASGLALDWRLRRRGK